MNTALLHVFSVNIPEPYFYNEGIYAHRKDMEMLVPFTLTVGTIHESNTMCSACTDITSELINEAFILDVDLDGFSTKDPFRDFYSAEQVMPTFLFVLVYLAQKTCSESAMLALCAWFLEMIFYWLQ